jgi:hypothetical protein
LLGAFRAVMLVTTAVALGAANGGGKEPGDTGVE